MHIVKHMNNLLLRFLQHTSDVILVHGTVVYSLVHSYVVGYSPILVNR
jgi:hypothetical protein